MFVCGRSLAKLICQCEGGEKSVVCARTTHSGTERTEVKAMANDGGCRRSLNGRVKARLFKTSVTSAAVAHCHHQDRNQNLLFHVKAFGENVCLRVWVGWGQS